MSECGQFATNNCVFGDITVSGLVFEDGLDRKKDHRTEVNTVWIIADNFVENLFNIWCGGNGNKLCFFVLENNRLRIL